MYGYLIGYTRRYLFVGGIGGVFFAGLAGAAGGVFGFVAAAFYGLCGIYGYGVGRASDNGLDFSLVTILFSS